MESESEIRCHNTWRRSEGYMCPMTQEGVDRASQRYQEFRKGYYAGLRAAALELEREHSANKHIHKFYLFAKEKIEELLK